MVKTNRKAELCKEEVKEFEEFEEFEEVKEAKELSRFILRAPQGCDNERAKSAD
jgi:hypothetical protein